MKFPGDFRQHSYQVPATDDQYGFRIHFSSW